MSKNVELPQEELFSYFSYYQFDNYQNQNKIFKTLYLTEGVKRNHLEEEFLHFDDAQASKSLIH